MSRKLGYVMSVILLAVLFSAPQVIAVIAITRGVIAHGGRWLGPSFPGIGKTAYYGHTGPLQFWRDKFVHLSGLSKNRQGVAERKVLLIDPESGDTEVIEVKFPSANWYHTYIFGDRIWFESNNETFELVENTLQKSKHTMPAVAPRDRELFLWNGVPAFVTHISNVAAVLTLQNETWTPMGILSIPDGTGEFRIDGLSIHFSHQSRIQILTSQDRVHLFVHNGGYLFYRLGLEIAPISTSAEAGKAKSVEASVDSDAPNFEVKTKVFEIDLAGWSVVCDKSAAGPMNAGMTQGLLIDGQPAALIVDDTFVDLNSTGNPTGRLYRFDGTVWTESASMPLPFGSTFFRAVTTRDGQRSYLATTTSYDNPQVFALEATGFRKTAGSAPRKIHGINAPMMNMFFYRFFELGVIFAILLTLGLLCGAGTALMMRWYTEPDYEFGVQTVKMASLMRRGIARLIDLGLIGAMTVVIGGLMLRDFDWLTFAEALNLHVDHPTMPIASRVAVSLLLWLVFVVTAIMIAQAVWGITPGKWLCRLRTVRTNLRPCGIAASLAREIVFFVDCCNFLCWTPGILSIALTDRRQRLGDLVADTIVVDSRSLAADCDGSPASRTGADHGGMQSNVSKCESTTNQ